MELPDFLVRDKFGFIRLVGHRIGLDDVVCHLNEGQSPEGVRKEFPTLPLQLIRQVAAFYQQNKAEVDAYVETERAETERLRAAAPRGPDLAELRRRRLSRRVEAK